MIESLSFLALLVIILFLSVIGKVVCEIRDELYHRAPLREGK